MHASQIYVPSVNLTATFFSHKTRSNRQILLKSRVMDDERIAGSHVIPLVLWPCHDISCRCMHGANGPPQKAHPMAPMSTRFRDSNISGHVSVFPLLAMLWGTPGRGRLWVHLRCMSCKYLMHF